MTKRAVASRIGCHAKSVGQWELDRYLPIPNLRASVMSLYANAPIAVLVPLARALNVPSPLPPTETTKSAANAPQPIDATRPASLDDALYRGAEDLDVSPRRLRAVVLDILHDAEHMGLSVRAARDAMNARPKPSRT
jgi:hypothetical protein